MGANQQIAASFGGSAAVTPISLVAHAHAVMGSGISNEATTAAINTTGATLLVRVDVVYGGFTSPSTYQFTDSKSNTWVGLTEYGGGGGTTVLRISYVKNPTVGSGHTFTGGDGSNAFFQSLCVAAFDHTDTAANADSSTGHASGIGTTIQAGSITPSVNNELVVAVLGYFDQPSARSCSIDSGFTITENATDAVAACSGLAYKVQTTAAATNPTWTAPINQYGLAASIASFKHS